MRSHGVQPTKTGDSSAQTAHAEPWGAAFRTQPKAKSKLNQTPTLEEIQTQTLNPPLVRNHPPIHHQSTCAYKQPLTAGTFPDEARSTKGIQTTSLDVQACPPFTPQSPTPSPKTLLLSPLLCLFVRPSAPTR
eukprot:71071-Chlamydomonas_euryale.AAC.1